MAAIVTTDHTRQFTIQMQIMGTRNVTDVINLLSKCGIIQIKAHIKQQNAAVCVQ